MAEIELNDFESDKELLIVLKIFWNH